MPASPTKEGAHGVLENGYALLRYKRWFRLMAQARLEVAMVYFIQHALARWQRREAAKRAHAPPPTGPSPSLSHRATRKKAA